MPWSIHGDWIFNPSRYRCKAPFRPDFHDPLEHGKAVENVVEITGERSG
jgi:hypothetical protein